MASETEEKLAVPFRDSVFFYLTAFFCMLAVFSLFIFLFLVPFFIEPALTTIYMEFDPEPVTCQTTEATFYQGLSKCHWSSCREGCTKEVYECWHIRVRYLSAVPVGQADSRSVRDRIAQHKAEADPSLNLKNLRSSTQRGALLDSSSSRLQSVLPDDDEEDNTFVLADQGGKLHVHEARLQPNVKGCGYPPDVECNAVFVPSYGVVGNNFSCYYSLVDPTLAITHLNIGKLRAELIYCLTIPIILFVISCAYLIYAYFVIYADVPPGLQTPTLGSAADLMRATENDDDVAAVEGGAVSQPTSPVSVSGKYGKLFQHPSPEYSRQRSSRIVRRAKSGTAIAAALTAPVAVDSSRSNRPKGMRLSKSMG